MVEIVPVAAKTLVEEFVEVPYRFYRGHPHWVPPLRRDERRRFSPRHNAFLAHAELRSWIARNNGAVVGRISLIEDRLHNEVHHERTAWFGFFEARDSDSAAALLATAERAAIAGGQATLRGPVNPSLNESAGLLVDGFASDPCLLMPYNPPEYAGFIERAGYSKAKDLLAWTIDLTAPLGGRIARIGERVARRHGILIRALDLTAFDRDLAILQSIYRSAWAHNWGFVAPTDAEIGQLAAELRPILDPEIIIFAEMDGRAVGCAVAVPDVNQVLKRMKGRLLPFGFIHFLRRRSIVDGTRVLLLGVLPELRRTGLYPLLIQEIFRRGVAGGYKRAELSWTLEDNDEINAGIEAAGGRHYKTYRIYEKSLRPDAGQPGASG
jgi:hypothetical protein